MRLQNLTFDQWLEHAFGHEVRIQQAPWYFDLDHDWWDPTPAQAIAYLTRLFENPEPALECFADRQIAQGLTYLLNTMASGDSGWLCSTEVPGDERRRCVEAIAPFFERLFKPRCTPHLSHLSENDAGLLNGACYMWWDVFPSLALASDPELPKLHDAALATMERILHLDSLACQESALHGLGHWQRQYQARVAAIIDDFCQAFPETDSRLLAYAKSARCGCVL
jgi:hypothetical protein